MWGGEEEEEDRSLLKRAHGHDVYLSPGKRARGADEQEESSSLSELHLSSDDEEGKNGAQEVGKSGVHEEEHRCPVCDCPMRDWSDAERNAHTVRCLDAQEYQKQASPLVCAVCKRSIGHLSAVGREAHANRCADELEKQKKKERGALSLRDNVRAGNNDAMHGETYFCLVCEKDLSAASGPARLQHVKSCAKKHKMGPEELRKKSDSLLQDDGNSKKKTVVEDGSIFHDPITGFTRRIGAQPRKVAKGTRKSTMTIDDDEDLQLALALSVSEAPQVLSQVEIPSLQIHRKDNDILDGAGFPSSPTLSQQVRSLVPSPIRPGPSVEKVGAAADSLPRSKLDTNRRSLWSKAVARPNREAGEFLAKMQPPQPSLQQEQPAQIAADEVVEEYRSPVPVQQVPAPAPRPAAPSVVSTFVAPVPRRAVLEVDANVLEEVRHALADVSNAYELGVERALASAQASLRSVSDAYYRQVGELAVARDGAVRAIMARYGLHEGHRDGLPMQAHNAAPPPNVALAPPKSAPVPEVVVVEREIPDNFIEALSPIVGKEKEDLSANDRFDDEGVLSGPPSPYEPPTSAFVLRAPISISTSVVVTPASARSAEPESVCPNYDAMGVEELRQHFDLYGLQYAKENVMRKKLYEIWDRRHNGYKTESMRMAAVIQAQEVPLDDSLTPYRPPKAPVQLVAAAAAPAAVPVEAEPEIIDEPSIGVDESMEARIVRFIRESRYWERLLLFEPIPILQLKEDLLLDGVRISKPDLVSFLDRKGIVFQDPQSKWK